MKNGDVVVKRIGSQLPYGTRSADWIENGQMIIVCGKVIQRRMLANLFCTVDGRQFLKVVEGEFAEPDHKLLPGVYFKLSNGAHIVGLDWPCFKAGIHDLRRFVNMCGRKHLREKEEARWDMRKMVLRAIADLHQWFVPGVYELRLQKFTNANSSRPLVVDQHAVRREDFASGEITDAECQKLKNFLKQWSLRAQRTSPIDKTELIEAINHLYRSFKLKPPAIVIASSPFEMVVAGFLWLAVAHTSKMGTNEIVPCLQEIDGLIAKEIYEATVQTAFRSVEDMVDSETERKFAALISQNRGATSFRSLYGVSGYAVESAVKEATIVLDRAGYSKQMADILRGSDKNIRDLILSFLDEYWKFVEYGNTQRYDELLTSALREVLGLRFTVDEKLVAWQALATNCGAMILHEEFCIVSDFPQVVQLDDEGRPHSTTGPSGQWKDGWKTYHWHGIRIPKRYIESPETITIAEIRAEQNLEVRRVLLEFYGMKRFLLDSDAQEMHRDEYGVLYSAEIDPRVDPVAMVKVKNATPEPDGSFKDYFLIVPPTITTAKAAVAWTFDIPVDEYCPVVQT